MTTISGADTAKGKISAVQRQLLSHVARILAAESRVLATRLKVEHLTGGTTRTRLRVRSGQLRGSVKAKPSTISGNTITSGITLGTIYARPHFGPPGEETIIRPKNVKYLTIPLQAAMTKAGVARGSARSGVFGDTFVHRTKSGARIIFGKLAYTKGKRAGTFRQAVEPLFLLLPQVTIPARIDPVQILQDAKPRILSELRTINFKPG